MPLPDHAVAPDDDRDLAVPIYVASANAVFDILVNGTPHIAYTFPGMKQTGAPDATFAVTVRTPAGQLAVTLYPNGSLTYVLAPYSLDGLSCAGVTYPGAPGVGARVAGHA